MVQTARVAWKDLASSLAKILHAKKPQTFSSPEAKQVSFEEAGEGEVKHLIGSNMLFEGPRARRFGFETTGESILTQMDEDLKGL